MFSRDVESSERSDGVLHAPLRRLRVAAKRGLNHPADDALQIIRFEARRRHGVIGCRPAALEKLKVSSGIGTYLRE